MKYAGFNDPDKTPVFDIPMDKKEIENFRNVLAKSYKTNINDIIWYDEISDNKPTGNIIYCIKAIDKNTGNIARDKITGEEILRQIFTLNVKGRN